jgi:hypothetical protein
MLNHKLFLVKYKKSSSFSTFYIVQYTATATSTSESTNVRYVISDRFVMAWKVYFEKMVIVMNNR